MNVIAYEWRLREVMAAAGMFSTSKLIPALEERGINLSSSQVYRLVTEKPERLNLHVMAALMDIFQCTADDLVRSVSLGQSAELRSGTEDSPKGPSSDFLKEGSLRPRRARILPAEDM